MELRQQEGMEKRRRKVITGPILVRSVKTGQVTASATYDKSASSGTHFTIWKS